MPKTPTRRKLLVLNIPEAGSCPIVCALIMLLFWEFGLPSDGAALRLENLAFRHQLGVLSRTVRRPKIGGWDRLFWIALKATWAGWRQASVPTPSGVTFPLVLGLRSRMPSRFAAPTARGAARWTPRRAELGGPAHKARLSMVSLTQVPSSTLPGREAVQIIRPRSIRHPQANGDRIVGHRGGDAQFRTRAIPDKGR